MQMRKVNREKAIVCNLQCSESSVVWPLKQRTVGEGKKFLPSSEREECNLDPRLPILGPPTLNQTWRLGEQQRAHNG